MLKYFGKCFLLFFLISFPTHLIFKSGFAFSQEDGIDKILGEYSLGNLNDVITSECYSADIGLKGQVTMSLECKSGDNGKGFSMTELR